MNCVSGVMMDMWECRLKLAGVTNWACHLIHLSLEALYVTFVGALIRIPPKSHLTLSSNINFCIIHITSPIGYWHTYILYMYIMWYRYNHRPVKHWRLECVSNIACIGLLRENVGSVVTLKPHIWFPKSVTVYRHCVINELERRGLDRARA